MDEIWCVNIKKTLKQFKKLWVGLSLLLAWLCGSIVFKRPQNWMDGGCYFGKTSQSLVQAGSLLDGPSLGYCWSIVIQDTFVKLLICGQIWATRMTRLLYKQVITICWYLPRPTLYAQRHILQISVFSRPCMAQYYIHYAPVWRSLYKWHCVICVIGQRLLCPTVCPSVCVNLHLCHYVVVPW